MIIASEKTFKNTAIDRFRYIDAVIPYIEKHLSDELKPENIAEQHFVPLSQLYRDFYAGTGHSVKEYIRKRRISNACEKIRCSELPLAIIADESGLQTQQAFNKLFKSVVGMTPMEYRQGDTYFYFYPFDMSEISLVVKVGTEFIPECKTTRFYDSCLIGIENKAIGSLGQIAGRVFGRNGKQIGNQFCYEVMTEQAGNTAGVGKTDLYATCVVNYNESAINDGWNYLYNIWLSAGIQPMRYIGIWEADPKVDYSNPENHSKRLYFYGVEVSDLDSIPVFCETKKFPESIYAIFKERKHGSPKYEWLKNAGYEPDGNFQKIYALDMEIFDDIDNDGVEWDVVIPVKCEKGGNI